MTWKGRKSFLLKKLFHATTNNKVFGSDFCSGCEMKWEIIGTEAVVAFVAAATVVAGVSSVAAVFIVAVTPSVVAIFTVALVVAKRQ